MYMWKILYLIFDLIFWTCLGAFVGSKRSCGIGVGIMWCDLFGFIGLLIIAIAYPRKENRQSESGE